MPPFTYDEPLYRPPSEAESLIFQVTLGCSHNRCAFCDMYKSKRFRVRPEAEVFGEIELAAAAMPGTRRIFLADGDALALKAAPMLRVLERLRLSFPRLERVSAYASPRNLELHSIDELRAMRAAGLALLYFGLESGDDDVLQGISKGATCAEMIKGCQKATTAGFELSLTVIVGLAGPRGSLRHAELTARALSTIKPRYASALTLMHGAEVPAFLPRPLTPIETLTECRALVIGIETDGLIFRSNHSSNYLALKGTLSADRERLLAIIDGALADPDSPLLRPEWSRGL